MLLSPRLTSRKKGERDTAFVFSKCTGYDPRNKANFRPSFYGSSILKKMDRLLYLSFCQPIFFTGQFSSVTKIVGILFCDCLKSQKLRTRCFLASKLKFELYEKHTKFEKNLLHGFDKSADLHSKRQNHEEDFFKSCVLHKLYLGL